MKMNSKILVVVLLAYFLDNLSAATLKPVKSTSLNGKNTPIQYKNTLVFSQPIKSHPLPPSRTSAPTTEPTNENDNHQGFDSVEEGDDYYYEEEEEEEEEEEGDEEHLENSKTVKIPTQSKSTISTKVNNSSNKFQTSQSKLSSSTSTKPITQENVKQESGNQQGFETLEGDDDEEEIEEEIEDQDQEELLENSKTVTSQPNLSSSISTKPIKPESVKEKSDNHQGFETLEGDDYEEEEIEEEIDDEDYEKPLGNSKTVASQPVLSSSTSKPECVNQENDNHQGFKSLEGDDYEEVSEENEDGHNVEEYSKDSDHNTLTDNTSINGVQVNLPVPMNNPTVPQLSEDELTENNYNESEYSLNTDEDHSSFQNDDVWEPKSFNINNNPTEISKTLDRKNDNTKDQLINTNEFESNPNDNTQIFTDKQEENSEYQFKNQYVLENKERIINGYEGLKKILYMLHDYASSTFNWIINKINYQMEQVSS